MTLGIPKNPEALTAEWLTAALGGSAVFADAAIESFVYEPIAAGVGFLGKLGRLRLTYAKGNGAPSTLVAKLPTEDQRSRQLALMFRFYEREVSFYRDIGADAGIRVPALHYGAADPSNGDFVMLLEDLAPARVGDQLVGCTAAQARSAVAAIARCHAKWWRSPRLESFPWLPATNDPVHHFAQPAYQGCWPAFVQFVGDKLSPELKRTGEELADKVVRMLDGIADRPQTLIHGDYRADNLFFGGSDGNTTEAAVDWQVSSRGGGVFDLAYFLSGNVATDIRRAEEKDLLRLYLRILQEHGVEDYSFEQCFEDYRYATLYCLVYAVIVIGTLDPTNARGLSLFHANFGRVAAAIADLDAAATMPR
jgi:hypothetical protein